MNQQQTEDFTPEEKIKNEIEVLKLKLEIECGAFTYTISDKPIPPEIELAWYHNIIHYEQMCKEAGYTSVYEMIGSPPFQNYTFLSEKELCDELQKLIDLMLDKGIEFAFINGCYPAEKLYRFVTEELFHEQVCRYTGQGHHIFCYEEFYPNHEFDLFDSTQDLLEELFGEGEWKPELLNHTHQKMITLNDEKIDLSIYSQKIIEFKITYPSFLFKKKETDEIYFDMQSKKACVRGIVETNNARLPFTFHYEYDFNWRITGLEMSLIV